MIVYGSKNKQLAKETIFEKCPNCGTQHSVEMHVFQKYAHVFWIPFFPMGKTGISQCDHCKQVLKLKQMPPGLVDSYNNIKAQTRTPVWMFAGLALLAFGITAGVISEKNKSAKNARLILNPQSGDIFEIKTADRQYTLYKVSAVKGDTVFVLYNNYESNKLSGLEKLKEKGDKAFSSEEQPLTKADLKKMLDNDEILDIDRK
jgi:hypothetical protein